MTHSIHPARRALWLVDRAAAELAVVAQQDRTIRELETRLAKAQNGE